MMADVTVAERLATIEAELKYARADIADLKRLIRWIGFTLGGAVLVAFAKFVLLGGLASVAAAAGVG